MKKKCVSKCKGLVKTDCNNECSYIEDKYCRLSSKYKMDENCNIIRKSKKIASKPQSIRSKSIPKSKPQSIRSKSIPKSNTNKVSPTPVVCLKSRECFTFGNEQETKSLFEFDNFTYATMFRSIGDKTANGFTKEIKYERNGRVEYAILKTPLKKTSDNLAYEYLVGQYINTKIDQYPCFVETYGLFLYTTSQLDNIKKNIHIDLKGLKKTDPFNFNIVCNSNTRLGLLTQNIKDSVPLWTLSTEYDFLHYDSVFCLYQIYFVLAQMCKEFTHYDINLSNVLCCNLNGYIHYHYHGVKTTSFKSKFLLKLIDYGRSHHPSALDYESKVCAHCKSCGIKSGLSRLFKDRTYDSFYHHTNSAYKNESADLRLFFSLFYGNKHESDIITPLQNMVKDLTWGYKKMGVLNLNGVIENLQVNSKINNVRDAESRLREFIHTSNVKQVNDAYYTKNKLGDLHIYSNRPMEFIPV